MPRRPPKPQPSGPPAWLRPVVLALAALLVLVWLSREGGDSDSWWHLKSGQFIDIIVMDCFEPVRGAAYYLPVALADPQQTDWKLVYRDAHDLVNMRRPPPEIQPLSTLDGLDGLEEQCWFLMSDGAPACAKGMVDVFSRIGDRQRVQKWELILENARLE